MAQSLQSARNSQDISDARRLKSRKALYRAFLSLLEKKSLDQISIREIAAVAGIGHTTFYRHFDSKEALLNELAADEIRRITSLAIPVIDAESTYAACTALCKYVQEKKALWRVLLTGGASSTVKEEWLTISRRVARESELTQHSDKDILELEVILSVSAILETLSWWLRQPQPLPPERVAALLDTAIGFHSEIK